jgi:hypothetical protein
MGIHIVSLMVSVTVIVARRLAMIRDLVQSTTGKDIRRFISLYLSLSLSLCLWRSC